MNEGKNMKGGKIALLILIGIVFVITSTFAITWYSVSATALSANTYTSLINSDNLKQLSGDQVPPELFNNLDSFMPTINNWLDSIFGYINGSTSKIILQMPEDSVIKPLLMLTAKQSYPEASQLTDEQFNAYFDQQYPLVKDALQTQLTTASIQIESQLKDTREIISIINTIALITLIISIVLLIIVVLLIRQLRSIFNWIGSYLLIAGVLATITGVIIIAMIPIAMQGFPVTEAVVAITALISSILSTLIITGIVVAVIGLAMLFIKYAFAKSEQ